MCAKAARWNELNSQKNGREDLVTQVFTPPALSQSEYFAAGHNAQQQQNDKNRHEEEKQELGNVCGRARYAREPQ